ncbi:MAG: hypothetical protein A2W66_04995 [Deltaproteobacteria bacterium RIFCSPLOWO2_02_56_12]|nr:MAG: hypothetical protein A2W66_04995 [Deltaproteobacteria bacterium RIFCSPLOWO2_02_56_12]
MVGRHGEKKGVFNYLASSGGFQVFYAILKASYLLLDNPELDIERLVKLHKSIDVVIDLVKAAFHVYKAAFHLGKTVPHRPYNRRVTRLE